MNEHVYKYYRWQGFIAAKMGRHWASFFLYDFARQERELQDKLTKSMYMFTDTYNLYIH